MLSAWTIGSAISAKPLQNNPRRTHAHCQTARDRVQIKFRSLEHTPSASGNRRCVNYPEGSDD